MDRVKIVNIKGEDADLNGSTGRLTAKFGCFPGGDFGVYLDDAAKRNNGICNIQKNEFIKINGGGERTQKEAKRAADKELREEGKRRGHKLTGMKAYFCWVYAYHGYIEDAGYKFLNGQVVLQ